MTSSPVQHAPGLPMSQSHLRRNGRSKTQTCPLLALPDELIGQIFRNLGWYDHWMLKATCKTLCDIGQQVNPLPLAKIRIYENPYDLKLYLQILSDELNDDHSVCSFKLQVQDKTISIVSSEVRDDQFPSRKRIFLCDVINEGLSEIAPWRKPERPSRLMDKLMAIRGVREGIAAKHHWAGDCACVGCKPHEPATPERGT